MFCITMFSSYLIAILPQVFPEGVMVPETKWQVEFMHFPKQQGCGIDIIEQMEDCGM